eukprot:6597297-Prymnesium_polylepis.1
MSLTNNLDTATGKEWQGTNIALPVIVMRNALEKLNEQVEANGVEVAMTLSSDEAASTLALIRIPIRLSCTASDEGSNAASLCSKTAFTRRSRTRSKT